MSKEADNKHNEALDLWINAKLAERQFPFQDEYWLAAQELIESDENKRRKKRFYIFWLLWVLIGLLVLSIGLTASYFYFSVPKDQPTTVSIPIIRDSLQTRLSISSPSLNDSTSIPPILSPHEHPSAHKNGISKQDLDFSLAPKSNNTHITLPIELTTVPPSTPPSTKKVTVAATSESPAVQADSFSLAPTLSESSSSLQTLTASAIEIVALEIPADSASKALDKMPPMENISPTYRPYFQLSVSVGYQQLWNTSSAEPFSVNRFSPAYGLHVHYVLNPKLRFSSGLQYLSIGSFDTSVDILAQSISFGLNQRSRNFQLDQLQYMEVPLSVQLRILKRSSVSFSLSQLFLLQTEHQIRERTSNPLGNETPVIQGTGRGFRDGIRPYVLGVGIGYHHKLFRAASIDVRAHMYPQHLFSDEIYQVDRSLPFSLGIRLSYDVFQFRLK